MWQTDVNVIIGTEICVGHPRRVHLHFLRLRSNVETARLAVFNAQRRGIYRFHTVGTGWAQLTKTLPVTFFISQNDHD